MSDMSVYEAILARRSIRSFRETPVTGEQTEALLRAAMAAPSACNLQPWAFIVVDDAETLARLRQTANQGNYNAPLAIVVLGIHKHIPWEGDGWLLDLGMAAQNIMLAATGMGLASVCVGGFDEDALRALLSIPPDAEPACIIEVGSPAYERPPRTWYAEDAVHRQRYQSEKRRTLRTLEMLGEDIKAGII